jgi:hypothetical protein
VDTIPLPEVIVVPFLKRLFPITRFLNGLLEFTPAPVTLIISKLALVELLPSKVNRSTRIISSLAIAVESGATEMHVPVQVIARLSRPGPLRNIPLVSESVFDHVTVPDPEGTTTVSPLAAEDTAARTSEKDGLTAVMVTAWTESALKQKQSKPMKNLVVMYLNLPFEAVKVPNREKPYYFCVM